MTLGLPQEMSVVFQVLKVLHLAVYGYLCGIVCLLTPSRWRRRKDISGQTVLITGAGSGIGRQLAVEFSKHAVKLVLFDLKRAPLVETEKLVDRSSTCYLYECDVSNRSRVYKTAEAVRAEVGKVDILVNNAGVVSGRRFMDLPDEAVVRTMEVNTLAHFWMCKAFLPGMLEANSGHVVCISSMAGLHGLPCLTDYCASKYGVVGLMEALRVEFDGQGKEGVKTTIVCPSLTRTGLFEGTTPALSVFMKTEFVASKILEGVLTDEEVLILPRWNFLIFLCRWTMPQIAVKAFIRNTGMLHFMDTFKGRPDQELINGYKPTELWRAFRASDGSKSWWVVNHKSATANGNATAIGSATANGSAPSEVRKPEGAE